MANFYTVADRTIAAATSLAEIEAAGLTESHTFEIRRQHAVAFSAGGPDAVTEAVMVYQAPGADLIGKRLF